MRLKNLTFAFLILISKSSVWASSPEAILGDLISNAAVDIANSRRYHSCVDSLKQMWKGIGSAVLVNDNPFHPLRAVEFHSSNSIPNTDRFSLRILEEDDDNQRHFPIETLEYGFKSLSGYEDGTTSTGFGHGLDKRHPHIYLTYPTQARDITDPGVNFQIGDQYFSANPNDRERLQAAIDKGHIPYPVDNVYRLNRQVSIAKENFFSQYDLWPSPIDYARVRFEIAKAIEITVDGEKYWISSKGPFFGTGIYVSKFNPFELNKYLEANWRKIPRDQKYNLFRVTSLRLEEFAKLLDADSKQ